MFAQVLFLLQTPLLSASLDSYRIWFHLKRGESIQSCYFQKIHITLLEINPTWSSCTTTGYICWLHHWQWVHLWKWVHHSSSINCSHEPPMESFIPWKIPLDNLKFQICGLNAYCALPFLLLQEVRTHMKNIFRHWLFIPEFEGSIWLLCGNWEKK